MNVDTLLNDIRSLSTFERVNHVIEYDLETIWFLEHSTLFELFRHFSGSMEPWKSNDQTFSEGDNPFLVMLLGIVKALSSTSDRPCRRISHTTVVLSSAMAVLSSCSPGQFITFVFILPDGNNCSRLFKMPL